MGELARESARERVLRELRRAPVGGVTRGELAILMLDTDDDEVTAALRAEEVHGRVTTSARGGLLRYHAQEVCDG